MILCSGETINQIKEKSGAFVQINKQPPQEHPDWKYFTIRGSANQIAHAQKLIQVRHQASKEFWFLLKSSSFFTPCCYCATGENV